MNPPQSPESRCSRCRLIENTLPDYLAYFLCHATIGESGFAANPECLAAAALRQLGIEVEKRHQLIADFDKLRNLSRDSV